MATGRNFSYTKGMEALATIQKRNFNPEQTETWNFAAAFANFFGAIEQDLEEIRRDIQNIKRQLPK